MSKTITKVIAGLGVVAGFGAAMLPISSYAEPDPNPKTVQLSVTVGSSISMSSVDTTTLGNINVNSADLTSMFSTVKVSTNNNNGYQLKIKGASTDVNMNHSDGGDSIAAVNGKPTAANPGWAVSFDDTDNWKKMPTSTETELIAKDHTGTANAVETKIHYGVATKGNQKVGTYTTSVQIQAVNK